MPQARFRVDGVVDVERYLFLLFGVRAIDRPVVSDDAGDWIPWHPAEGALDTVTVESAGEDHTVQVTLSAWDSAPEFESAEWDSVREISVLVGNQGIEPSGLTSGLTGQRLEIPSGTYRMRVCCRGRAEIAARLDSQQWDADEWLEGIEVYRFDFWKI